MISEQPFIIQPHFQNTVSDSSYPDGSHGSPQTRNPACHTLDMTFPEEIPAELFVIILVYRTQQHIADRGNGTQVNPRVMDDLFL
jgi:hypothetical protein